MYFTLAVNNPHVSLNCRVAKKERKKFMTMRFNLHRSPRGNERKKQNEKH